MTHSYGAAGFDRAPGFGAPLVAVVERGLVAMMAVGDDELLVLHPAADQFDGRGIANAPHAVLHVVLVGHANIGRARRGQNRFDFELRVAIRHEDLAEVRMGGQQQVVAIDFGAGERLLVPMHDPGVVLFDLAQGDQAAALGHLGGRAWKRKTLRVVVDGRGVVRFEHAFRAPGAQAGGSPRVDVIPLVIGGSAFAQDDAHQIVWAVGVISVLHGRGNLVVGLSYHVL